MSLKRNRRWHDARGDLSQIIDLLTTLPEAFLAPVIQAIRARADSCWETRELLKSLGTEKILALHKSKRKRRNYDQNPDLHQTVNLFLALPPDSQDTLASESLQFLQVAVQFVAGCQNWNLDPSRELPKLSSAFVGGGPRAMVTMMEKEYPFLRFQRIVQQGDGSDMQVRVSMRPDP
ncbi:MAG: hypothetical protein IPK79_01560 [Vampirovibrionales bacterium]|nr:hypothetical protein [Vampirovibrionales bacterium]